MKKIKKLKKKKKLSPPNWEDGWERGKYVKLMVMSVINKILNTML